MLMKKELIENNKILKWENRKLQQRIDKAIEYIEIKYLSKLDDFEKPFILTDKNDWNKLLEILKGSDKE